MNMKKVLIILSVIILLILLTFSYVLAYQNTSDSKYNQYENIVDTYDVSTRDSQQNVIAKGNEILNVLNSHSLTRGVNDSNTEYAVTKIIKDNNYNTQSFLYTNNKNYEIQLDTTDLSLIGINSLDINYNLSSENLDKKTVQEYIDNVYKDLKLDSSYKLMYLEKFDGALWEADYQKEYDGIYNPYESVKIIFSPVEQKIASLKVFKMKYDANQQNNITEEFAKTTFNEKFANTKSNMSELKAEIVFTRPNNLVDSNRKNGSKALFNNNIKKAWKITNNDGLSLYIDIDSGEIIGGEQLR